MHDTLSDRSEDIIEQHMIYQIKGGYHEEIQKSKVDF